MYLPTNNEDIKSTVLSTWRRVRDRMSDYYDDTIKFSRMYDSYINPDEYPMKFKMFYPVAFSTIETILPRFVHGLLSKIPLLQIMKAHPMTSDDAVYSASRLLNNKWMTDSYTWMNILMALKEGFITGLGGGIVQFKQQARYIKYKEPVQYNGVTYDHVQSSKKILEINRPFFNQADMLMTGPDIDRSYQEDMRFVFNESYKSLDELLYGPIKYENHQDIIDAGDWPINDLWLNRKLRNSDRYVDLNIVPDHPRSLLQVVWREWTRKGEVIHLMAFVNEKVMVRHERIAYWPWVFFTPNPVPNEFLGRSELHHIESLQFGLNDLVNIGGDNMLMALTKMWLVGNDADANLDQFVLEPMNVIQVDDINQVRSESWGDINPSIMHLQRTVIEAIQQTTGISDMLRGATPPRKEFATTVLALQQAAEARIDSKIKMCEKTTIVPIAQTMLRCAQEYLTQAENIPDATQENGFDEIDMYRIQGVFDLKMRASSMGMKELQRAALNDLVPSLAQLMPQQVGSPTLSLTILKALLSTFDLDVGEELNAEIDKSIQQAEQQQQQQLAQGIAALQNPAGAGGPVPPDASSGMAGPPAQAPPQLQATGGQVNRNPMVAGMAHRSPTFGNSQPS